MKKILLLSTLVIGSVLINKASAQVDVNANIGVQPEWGPSGYDNAAYYYLPDIETYYCVPTRMFTWFENGQWVSSPYLPACYANYDLYSGYKIVLNERTPWLHFYDHRRIYAPYRYRHDQLLIRDARGYYGGGRANYGRAGYERATYGHADYSYNNYGRGNYAHSNYGGGRVVERRDEGHRGRVVERREDHGRSNDRGRR
ncbi:MAG TPA: hypothetical protein VGM41_16095 [Chitinophagaceae bacterium]|jgi:hypothetical protein